MKGMVAWRSVVWALTVCDKFCSIQIRFQRIQCTLLSILYLEKVTTKKIKSTLACFAFFSFLVLFCFVFCSKLGKLKKMIILFLETKRFGDIGWRIVAFRTSSVDTAVSFETFAFVFPVDERGRRQPRRRSETLRRRRQESDHNASDFRSYNITSYHVCIVKREALLFWIEIYYIFKSRAAFGSRLDMEWMISKVFVFCVCFCLDSKQKQ